MSDRPPPVIPDHDLLREIGSGSYGKVWLARNIMGAYRAVKIVHKSTFEDGRPFEREYSGIQQFEPVSRLHESQVDILHVGRQEDWFYYVMELADDQVNGQEIDPLTYQPRSLHSLLRQRGHLSAEETLDIALALTTAVHHLHSHGLVHRDIKPSNIVFVHGMPKLADIGLVSSIDGTRSFVGTEGFLPPEGPGTPQADIYSLGKVLYEACTGRDRKDYPELPTALHQLPDRERLLELNAIISKACRAEVRDRYQSAEQMRQDLLLAQGGKSVIRLRKIERRLSLATRAAVIATILVALLAIGYLYQSQHSRVVADLALRTKRAETGSRDALVRLQVANATRLMRDGRLGHTLLWLAKALPNVHDNPAQEEVHRIRIASVLANHPKLTHQLVHHGPVFRCAFTPDGTRLLTHSSDDTITAFELPSGKLLYSVQGPFTEHGPPHFQTYCSSLVFSPDGQRLIVRGLLGQIGTRILSVSSGKPIEIPAGAQGDGLHLLDSIDGRKVLTLNSNSVVGLLELDTGNALGTAIKIPGSVFTGRLTPSGNHVAIHYHERTTGYVSLRVWDTRTGAPVGPPLGVPQKGRYLLSKDGSKVLVEDHFLTKAKPLLVDTGSGQILTNVPYSGTLRAFVLTHDAQWLITDAARGEKQLWNIETGEFITLALADNIRFMTTSADGLLLAITGDGGEVRVLNRLDGKPATAEMKHGRWGYDLAFSPDGRVLASCSQDMTARIWDLAARQVPRLLLEHPSPVANALYSPDGKEIATLTTPQPQLRFWNAAAGTPVTPPVSEADAQNGQMHFSPDGRFVVSFGELNFGPVPTFPASILKGAWLWRRAQVEAGPIHIERTRIVVAARFNRDGTRLLTLTHSGEARLWETETGRPITSFDSGVPVRAACFLGDQVVTTASAGTLRFWNSTTGEQVREFQPGLPKGVRLDSLAASPDERYLAVGATDQNAHVFDLSTGAQVSSGLFQGSTPVWLQFSPTGRFLATRGPSPFAKIWRLGDSEPWLPPLEHKEEWVFGTEFSPGERFIGTCNPDGDACVWDAKTGELLQVPAHHPGGATAIRFHPAAPEYLTAGRDAELRVWTLPGCHYSPGQLGRFAELLSFSRIDATGSVLPISLERAENDFLSLSGEAPELFATSDLEKSLWYRLMAGLAAKAGKDEQVIAHLNRASAYDPQFFQQPTGDEMLGFRGYALANLGRYHEAAEDFRRATELAPRNLIWWRHWWQCALAQNLTREASRIVSDARDQFESLVLLDGIHVEEIRGTLARMIATTPPSDDALALGFKLIDFATPHYPASQKFARGQLLLRTGRAPEAIPLFEQVSREWPVQSLLWLTIAQQRAGEPDKAKLSLAKALARKEELQNAKESWTEQVMHAHLIREATGNPEPTPLPQNSLLPP